MNAPHKESLDVGIKVRIDVFGYVCVDKALAGGSSNSAIPIEDSVTEICQNH